MTERQHNDTEFEDEIGGGISNAIAAVKSAPLRTSERASARAASEQDDEARPMSDGFEALFEGEPSANNVSSPTPLCVVTQELAGLDPSAG